MMESGRLTLVVKRAGLMLVALAGLGLLNSCGKSPTASQDSGPPVQPADQVISGTVSSAKGPEAGVWVIAETQDLPTKMVKIVVTDDQGRYLLPQLPAATYDVFVRGYGLVDSARVKVRSGSVRNLRAELAPSAAAAAQYYPAAWWMTMVKLPGDAAAQKNFATLMGQCLACHQLGDLATRKIPPVFTKGGVSSLAAWDARTAIGPASGAMNPFYQALGDDRKTFADWTDAIGKGAIPASGPSRPAGLERNVVITEWDWGGLRWGRTDMAASNPLNPSLYANGPVWGLSEMTDDLMVLDPSRNSVKRIHVPSPAPQDDNFFNAGRTADPWFGEDVWARHADPRSSMVLPDGRILATNHVRKNPNAQPAFCGANSNNPYGKYFPIAKSTKQLSIYDPKTNKWEYIDTCFSVDHNVIDTGNVIYFGQDSVIGWIDLKTWNRTHDAALSQGWCPGVIDTNGDGKITPGWSEPDEAVDSRRDHRITFGAYTVAWNAKDGSIYASGIGQTDRKLVRLVRGANPPMTCRAEVFVPPSDAVFGSGGVTTASDGLVWQNWRISGQFTSFNRAKCAGESKDATGKDCAASWTVYDNPHEPRYANAKKYKATMSYLTDVDEHETLGLGKVPLYGQTNTDSFEVLNPATKSFISLRVPYPFGFFPRSASGRIDNPKAGWKGKGLWTTYSSYAGWHIEGPGYPNVEAPGGTKVLSKVVKIQMRPSPLAR